MLIRLNPMVVPKGLKKKKKKKKKKKRKKKDLNMLQHKLKSLPMAHPGLNIYAK